jgi:ketosteroid isomerase-like protein
MAGVKAELGRMIAVESGDFGWAACQPMFRFPDGNGFAGRLTVVGAKVEGGWKFAHFHLSVGVPNEDLIGRGLTT